jgi:hypothetical protein
MSAVRCVVVETSPKGVSLAWGPFSGPEAVRAPAPQLRVGHLQVLRVPKDDGRDQQVEPGGAEELVLKAAVAVALDRVALSAMLSAEEALAPISVCELPPCLAGPTSR